MRTATWISVIVVTCLVLSGCSCGSNTCEVGKADACADGLVCEPVAGAEPSCFPATVATGRVFNAETDAAIEGARVVLVDANTNAAASNVALTDAAGKFSVRLDLPRSTDSAADVKSRTVTLRVAAKGYQDFPSPIRQAIPLTVTRAEDKDALPNNSRDVALLPLKGAAASNTGSISGRVLDGETGIGGVLVVAESTAGAFSGLSDAAGNFAVLNLPAATFSLKGYIGGSAFKPVDNLVLGAGEAQADVRLERDANIGLSKLTGGIQIVNGQTSTTETLIVLALASTREVPAGLSAMTASSRFEIAGIPPGTYDILASYNNDDLVIDPDPSQLPRPIRVNLPTDAPGGSLDVGSFKITGDVRVVSPGAATPGQTEAPVATAGLTFRWDDDSGEDFYGIEVFDAFGARLWGSEPSKTVEPTVKAAKNTTSLPYAGPALIPGGTYQWRITSYKCNVSQNPCTDLDPISSSENLRGIFSVAQ